MDKIAMKLVDMNIKTAARVITPKMVRHNIYRNLGKMTMHPFNMKVRMGATKNIISARNLYRRESAATLNRSFQNTFNKLLKSYDNNADFWKR